MAGESQWWGESVAGESVVGRICGRGEPVGEESVVVESWWGGGGGGSSVIGSQWQERGNGGGESVVWKVRVAGRVNGGGKSVSNFAFYAQSTSTAISV